jgi:hypothetical protein
MRNTELIAHSADDEIDHVRNLLGLRIEGGHRRENDGSCFGTYCQVPELHDAEWGLSRYQNQFAPFFQVNISCPLDQVLGQPMGDGGHRPHTARANDHATCQERATRDTGREILKVMVSKALDARAERCDGLLSKEIDEPKRCQTHGPVEFSPDDLAGGWAERKVDAAFGS